MEPVNLETKSNDTSNVKIENNTINNSKTVALNDATSDPQSPELDRPGTIVIHLSEQSEKDINYENNKKIRNANDSKDKKNQKELSQIPYSLERLHNKTPMINILRVTKLRDLFAVSYIFRYIICIIIGCISFFILAFLWKILLQINSCATERPSNSSLTYMPFAYGFMSAYKYGLLVSVPLFYILLPTIHVTHYHRTRFILLYLFIIFILFTSYGFYGLNWTLYSYISSCLLGILALIIFFYWGGYFAFWVIFPLFSAAFFALLFMGLMREYVWTFINSDPLIFGLIYPIYLTILQTITFKCMLWFRLPYKIRQFFYKLFPHCCCKTNNGQTPVYYDNYNNFWTPSKYDLKYSQKRMSTSTHENKHENNDTTVIIKTESTHHAYKSTELELSVEDVWSNDILFVAGGTVIVLMESMRVAGMIALKNDIPALILNVISSIILECFARNNLYWEFIYKCCLKKENPPLTRFYSSILGTRYQTEYIPYCVIIMMNLVIFGPTDSCKMKYLGNTTKMKFNKYWYIYIILFASEILSDLIADKIKKIGRNKGYFGDKGNGDPAREATYVKLKPWMMVCVFIAFFAISLIAYEIDYDAKTRTIV